MAIKVTVPNTGSDYLTFGSTNTPDAAKIGGYDEGSNNGRLELYTTSGGTSTERMRIDSNGNIGIGVTPSVPLDVSTTTGRIWFRKGADTGGTADGNGIQSVNSGATDNAALNIRASTITAITGSTERMRIDSNGNVSIGTTGSVGKMTLIGKATEASSLATSATNSALFIEPYSGSSWGTAFGSISGQIQYIQGVAAAGDSARDLSIQPYGGNVGIGTSSPSEKLEVVGNIKSSGTNAGVSAVCTTGASRLNAVSNTRYWSWYTDNTSSGALRLNDETSGAERMRIDSSGNVLVGTTSPISAGKIYLYFNGATTNAVETQDSGTNSGAGFLSCRNSAGTQIGSVTRNGTTNAVLFNTTSDYRLKENVTPLKNSLEKISKLKPVQWIWKDCNGQTGEGFIAHEVQEVIPSAVNGEKDAVDADGNPKYQGMDASYLVATLTAAIQELKAELDTVKLELSALKGTA